MTIERDFLNGDGTLPILFRISETFEAWDGQAALVIDHLLNHLKMLTSVAEGPVDPAVFEVLARYPHYGVNPGGYSAGTSRRTVAKTLLEECVILLKCLIKIAPIMEIESPERTRLLEQARDKVPFLDYHYVGDASLSDAWRED